MKSLLSLGVLLSSALPLLATEIAAVQVTAPAGASSTVDITSSGIGDCEAVIAWGSQASVNGTEYNQGKYSFGMWSRSSGTQSVRAVYNANGMGTGNARSGHHDLSGAIWLNLDNEVATISRRMNLTSTITDGVQLTRIDSDATNPLVNAVLIGEGAESTLANITTSGTLNGTVDHVLPFDNPDCAILVMTSDTLDGLTVHNGVNHFCVGFGAFRAGRFEIASVTTAEPSDLGSTAAESGVGSPGFSWGAVSTTRLGICSDPANNTSDGIDWEIDVQLVSDNTLRATTTKVGSDTSPPEITILVLKFPDLQCRAGILTTPTATGVQAASLTSPPSGEAVAMLVAPNTMDDIAEFPASGKPSARGFGAWANNGVQLSTFNRFQVNFSPTVTKNQVNTQLINIDRHNGAASFVATLDSVSPGSVNINATEVYTAGFKIPYLLFEPETSPSAEQILAVFKADADFTSLFANASTASTVSTANGAAITTAVTTLEARHDTTDTNFTLIKGAGFDADDSLQSINSRAEQIDSGIDQLKGDDETYNPSLHGLTVLKATADALPTESEIVAASSGGPINQLPVSARNIVRLSSRADGVYTASSKWRLRAGETRTVAIDASRQLGGSKRLYGMAAPASSDTNVATVGTTEYTDYGVDRPLAKIKLTIPDGVAAGSTSTITVELQPTQGEVIEAEVVVEVR